MRDDGARSGEGPYSDRVPRHPNERNLRIAAVARAFPEHYYPQETLLAAFREHWGQRHHNLDRLEQLHRNVLVGGRHLALPLEEYAHLERWGQANDAWIRVAREIGGKAVREAVATADLDLGDLGALLVVSVTGIATPSLDALIMNELDLPTGLRRVPIFGLGCVAGAAGVARAADFVKAYPDKAAVLLSVELCSLTLQREDLSVPNLISSGLFGDGAACAVITGGDLRAGGPEIVATRSIFYPDTEDVMGWRISERGFQVVLSAEVPAMAREHLGADVEAFLSDHGLDRSDVTRLRVPIRADPRCSKPTARRWG